MTDLTSTPTPEAPKGQAEGQAEGQPESTGKAPVTDKLDLNQSEDFRRVQRSWQQKWDNQQTELQQKESRLQELEERGLDDFEKVQLQNRRLSQAVQQRDQYIGKIERDMRVQQQIDADLTFIAGKFEVPVHELRSAETYDEAMDLAKGKFEEMVAARYKPQEESEQETTRPPKHKPFLGGSKPSGGASSIEKKIDAAETTVDLMRLWYDTGE